MIDEPREGRSGARRLATQSTVYAIGNAIIKASGVLLAPFYLDADVLPRVDYGHLGLLEITGQLCILTAGLGLTSAMIRLASDATEADADAAPGSALAVTAISGLAMAAVFWIFASPLAAWLLGEAARAVTIRWYGGYVALQTLLAIPYAFIRLREQATLFVIARVAEIAVLILGVYIFLVRLGLGLEGIVYAFVLSSAVAALTLVSGMVRRMKLRVSRQTAVRMMRYGAPLALGGLALPVLHAGDRYLLQWFEGSETVALYYWGSRLSGLLNMLFVQSVSMAFAVLGVKALTGHESDVSLHRRTFRHFTVWAGWAALTLSLFALEATRILTDDPRYPLAAPLVLPLSLGYLFYGHFVVFQNTLLASGRTQRIALTVVAATVANLALNVVLIPRMGMYGAAIATVISYFVLAAFTAVLSRREYPVNYAWKDSALVLVLVVALYLGAHNTTTDPSAQFVLRLVAVGIYMPLIVAFRVYRMEEIRMLLDRLRGLFRR